jgi:kynurenine 3-monooxygenase
MRSRTADPRFLLQKKIEGRLHQRHPQSWIPAYSQVTFSPQIRYSEALHNSMKQEAIMQEIMRDPQIDAKWDSEEIENLILSKLQHT